MRILVKGRCAKMKRSIHENKHLKMLPFQRYTMEKELIH